MRSTGNGDFESKRSLSDGDIALAIKGMNYHDRLKAARGRFTSHEDFMTLALDVDAKIRMAVGSNRYAPEEAKIAVVLLNDGKKR